MKSPCKEIRKQGEKKKKNNNGPGKDRTICMRSVGKGAMEEMKEKLTEGRGRGRRGIYRERDELETIVSQRECVQSNELARVCVYACIDTCSRGRIHDQEYQYHRLNVH